MVITTTTLAALALILAGCAGYTIDGDRISRAGDALRDRPSSAPPPETTRLETTCVKQGVYVHCR